MSFADRAQAAYARAFAPGLAQSFTVTSADGARSAVVPGRPRSDGEDEIAGASGRNGINAILQAEAFQTYGEPRKGDTIEVNGRKFVIEYVDSVGRTIAGSVLAYEVKAIA
ncbi:MAG: hypothetical protein AAGC81_02370 [Pseudomonadota bacterium]